MGKQEFVKQYLYDAMDGAAFSAELPLESFNERAVKCVIREAQLCLYAWLGSVQGPKNEWELVERVRKTVAGDLSKLSSCVFYALVFDNHRDVTAAKFREREQRDENLKKEKERVPYTDEECAAFYDGERLGEEELMKAAALPDFPRLRLSKGAGKQQCMQRLLRLIEWAAVTGSYGERFKGLKIQVVRDNQLFEYDNEPNSTQVKFEPEKVVPTPSGVHEAEFLCLWVASTIVVMMDDLMRDGNEDMDFGSLGILILCADTDIILASMTCAERLLVPQHMTSTDKTPLVLVNLTPANKLAKKRKTGEGAVSEMEEAATANEPLLDPKKVPYIYDMFALHREFILRTMVKKQLPWHVFKHPLEALILLASLGGTDKVESMSQCTAEGIFKKFIDEKEKGPDIEATRRALAPDFLKCEPYDFNAPLAKRVKMPRRVLLNELAVADFFLRAAAAKGFIQVYDYVWQTLESAPTLDDEVLQKMLTLMCDLEQAKFDKKEAEYPELLAKKTAAREEYEKKWANEPTNVKKPKPPVIPQKPEHAFRPPDMLIELRGKVRRTLWQLLEVMNVITPNGVPDCAARSGEYALWGWTHHGELDNDVKRFDAAQSGESVLV